MFSRKVLIVEDDQDLQELYATILKKAKIKTLLAKNGNEAVTIALEEHPDAILMDVMLPDISGHDAVKKIRLDDWGKKAVVIFLTNRSDAGSIVKAIQAGSEDYIIKSQTTNEELLNKVRSAMMSK